VVGEATSSLSPSADTDWWQRFEKLLSLHLPDLTGKTVLDVGSFDGYFSFAAERFGASRVAAVDTHAWRRPGARERFEHTRDTLASRVEDLDVAVLDVSPRTVGKFDVVLFLGALNHMRDPLLALERMASVTNELLVVETLVDVTFLRAPAAAFYPWKLLRDETNWWGPNPAAVVGMLHSVGFTLVVPYQPKRVSAARALGLPAGARAARGLVSSTPWRSQGRLIRDFAKSVLTQNRLVTHSCR
jgi:tRNA (mo5U34)-methyltransferase